LGNHERSIGLLKQNKLTERQENGGKGKNGEQAKRERSDFAPLTGGKIEPWRARAATTEQQGAEPAAALAYVLIIG